ncbi:MAG: tRNA (adenosine(37)-N6)-dimethylallyltransferase MiaA [Clostridia bacterium]|jgi:tRNA dimethylallyltransferase|nr:tRNA (adenosine(37)-N6)-dimethylallyltransferase MiaA [Clostridia bacterium]
MSGGIKVAAVVGATASGKTALAVELARRLNGEVISADSMQIYRGLSIATAKPTAEEMNGIPHHLIDFAELDEEFSVARFCELGHRAIEGVSARGRLPIVCGGTGLYVDSLLNNIIFPDIPSDGALRDRLNSEFDEHGGGALLERLRKADPETAEKLSPADRKRIVRGLEVYELSGTTLSEFNRRSREFPDRYRSCIIGIGYRDRQKLYDRINLRVDMMLRDGLIDEVKGFYSENAGKTVVQAIGCKELLPYLRGEQTLDEAVEKLKMETRRFAKRQLTWFRRNDKIIWIYADECDSFAELAACAENTVRSELDL